MDNVSDVKGVKLPTQWNWMTSACAVVCMRGLRGFLDDDDGDDGGNTQNFHSLHMTLCKQ